LKAAYEAAKAIKPKSWQQVEEVFLRGMEGFDENVASGLAQVLVHVPDKGHVTTRYYGWDANRPRGMRRHQAEPAVADATPTIVSAPRLRRTSARGARRRPGCPRHGALRERRRVTRRRIPARPPDGP
jgi:hypothetical protein